MKTIKGKLNLVLFLAVTVGQVKALGQNEPEVMSSIPDKACAQSLSDVYENPSRYTSSSQLFANLCVNTDRFRAANVVNEKSHVMTIANYGHKNQFWKAELPMKSTDWAKAYFQIVRFPIVEGVEAAHTQIRFVAKTPIRLINQKTSEVEFIKDVIFSVEAALPKGKEYNFALGAFNNFAIVGRMASGLQREQENGKFKTEQYNLNISSDDVLALVKKAAHRSEEMGINKFYNTIKPNCTTEAFDLLDLLPSVKGKARPFNTVLWVDPIAGPSIKALKARNLLGARGPDLGDELKGITTVPKSANVPKPVGIIRELPGAPYALVTIFPEQRHADSISKEVFDGLQSTLTSAVPRLAEAAITSGVIGTNVPSVLNGVIEGVHRELRRFLRGVNSKLPDQPVQIVSYLVPWDLSTKPLTLVSKGISADLPFEGAAYYLTNSAQTRDLFTRVTNNMRRLQLVNYRRQGSAPIFFIGAAIRLQLERNQSEQALQLALGWNPKKIPFSTNPAQVVFDQVNLPAPESLNKAHKNNLDTLMNEVGALVITHKQKHYEKFNAKLHFEFGALDRVNESIGYKNMGLLNVEKYLLEKALPIVGACVYREKTVPEMRGRILKNISGNKTIDAHLENRPISLGFYEFDLVYGDELCKNSQQYSLNPEQQKLCEANNNSKTGIMLWNVDVRTKVNVANGVTLGCVRHNMITDQFTNEANASIDYQVDQFIKTNHKKIVDTIFSGAN